MVDWAVSKLVLSPTVLGEWGEENVKLGLSEMDNFGSGFCSKLLEVELGNSTKGFEGRFRSGRGWGADHVGVGIDGGGFKGVRVDEGNASAGRRRRVLGGTGVVDIVWAGARGYEEGEAGDNELKAEFGTGGSSRQPGDNRGQGGAGRILEGGASGTWVIPSIVGTVEGIVDNLKGGGGVLLVDGVQVRPRGNGEGR